MVEYVCQNCDKKFSHKSTFKRHLARKFPCKKEAGNFKGQHRVTLKTKKSECDDCGKQFTNRHSKSRHMTNQRCYKTAAMKRLESERDLLKDRLDKLAEQLKDSGTTNININIVNINSFGNESMSHISPNLLQQLIQKPGVAVPELLRQIHFDPEHPENHNIRITNRKENYAQIFLDQQWLLAKKADVLNKMVDKGVSLLDNCFEEHSNTLSDFKRCNFEKFQEEMGDDASKARKRVCDDAELLVLNNSK